MIKVLIVIVKLKRIHEKRCSLSPVLPEISGTARKQFVVRRVSAGIDVMDDRALHVVPFGNKAW